MVKKKVQRKKKEKCMPSGCSKGQCSGMAYGLGFIGALVYYISAATGFWNGAWGIVKAMLWPAFLVYELMKYLGM